MKDWIRRIWTDPVWSKVIATGIVAFIGVLSSLIKGWLCPDVSLLEAFKAVFGFKINLWAAIGIVLLFLGIKGQIANNKRKKLIPPEPPFLKEFTNGSYQSLNWKWRWKWSPTYKFYYIVDLDIECPICHAGILHFEFVNYRCSKCNNEIPYEYVHGNSDAVEKQILEDARSKYSDFQDMVGKIQSGMYKG